MHTHAQTTVLFYSCLWYACWSLISFFAVKFLNRIWGVELKHSKYYFALVWTLAHQKEPYVQKSCLSACDTNGLCDWLLWHAASANEINRNNNKLDIYLNINAFNDFTEYLVTNRIEPRHMARNTIFRHSCRWKFVKGHTSIHLLAFSSQFAFLPSSWHLKISSIVLSDDITIQDPPLGSSSSSSTRLRPRPLVMNAKEGFVISGISCKGYPVPYMFTA